MPLKNKYLKYNPEITLEMFKEIWTKLINSGWKATCDFVSIRDRFQEFKNGEMLYNDAEDKKTFYINYKSSQKYIKDSGHILLETTVQEILGYDPFAKEEFVLPKKWCIKRNKENYIIINNWFKSNNYGNPTAGDQYIRISNDNKNYDSSFSYDKRFENYTEITFDQFKKYVLKESIEQPKQTLKQAVHCKTQEEYKFAKETLGATFNPNAYIEGESIIPLDAVGSTITLNRFWHSIYNDYNLLSFQEWCDLNSYKMEKEVKFEVGKWYKLNNCWWAKFHSLKGNLFYMSELINADFKYEKKNEGVFNTDLDSNNSIILASLEEIQRYLPVNHPDKITPVIQQTRDMQSEFKVGEWVIVIPSANTFSNFKRAIGHIFQIRSDGNYAEKFFKGMESAIDPDNRYSINYKKENVRHATPEEINNHLISIGQIPAGKPLNSGLEPNKDGMFKYTTYNGSTFIGKSLIIPGPLKMTLSIDDEELPMVNIIKTKTVNLLNLE